MSRDAERKRSLIVGLFVLIGLIILVAGILVLGTQQNRFSKNLMVTTHFGDVKGLKVGNNVWFSGVKVGIIKEIAFENVGEVRVVLSIEEKKSDFIRKDVVATLGSDGLIGNSIISLVGGSPQFPAIVDGDEIESGAAGGMDALMDMVQDNGGNLSEITKNLAILSQQLVDGKGTVGSMLTDETIANSLKSSMVSLQATMNSVDQSMKNIAELTAKFNSDQGLIHDVTTDTAVFASFRESAAQLQGIAETANTLIANLSESLIETASRLNEKDNAVGLLTNDPATADEIKQILYNLNASTAKLDENMEALQHNFLFRGFFRKQAKAAEKERQDSIKAAQAVGN